MVKTTQEDFIRKCNETHKGKYDYSKTVYTGAFSKVIVTCPTHGDFEIIAKGHKMKHGCRQCYIDSKVLSNDEFIKRSKKKHGDLYDYSKVNYTGLYDPVTIICSKHGEFLQKPGDHFQGCGCPNCRTSQGERLIKQILIEENIDFETQKTFPDCKHVAQLKYDFYIPSENTLIEFDGIQHFKPVNKFGGIKAFEETQFRDNLKNEFASVNDIKLIRFRFDDSIEFITNKIREIKKGS